MTNCFYFVVSLIQFLLVQGDDFNSDVFYQRRSTTTAVYKPESFRQTDYEQIRIIQEYYQKQMPCYSSGGVSCGQPPKTWCCSDGHNCGVVYGHCNSIIRNFIRKESDGSPFVSLLALIVCCIVCICKCFVDCNRSNNRLVNSGVRSSQALTQTVYQSRCLEDTRPHIITFEMQRLSPHRLVPRDRPLGSSTVQQQAGIDASRSRRGTATSSSLPTYDNVRRQSSTTLAIEQTSSLPPSYHDFMQRINETTATSSEAGIDSVVTAQV